MQELQKSDSSPWKQFKKKTAGSDHISVFTRTDKDNYKHVSRIQNCIIDAPMLPCFTTFMDIDIMKSMDEEIVSLDVTHAINETNCLCKMVMKFPWPMSNREIVIKSHCLVDKTNQAIIFLTKSQKAGDKYFDVVVPDVASKKLVRMDIMSVDVLQYLSPTQTRYIQYANYDPMITALSADMIDGSSGEETEVEAIELKKFIEALKSPEHKFNHKCQQFTNHCNFMLEDIQTNSNYFDLLDKHGFD